MVSTVSLSVYVLRSAGHIVALNVRRKVGERESSQGPTVLDAEVKSAVLIRAFATEHTKSFKDSGRESSSSPDT